MRRALAFLLLLLPLATAVTPEAFVQPYLQTGEFAYSRQVNYSSKTYYLVWVNATETFVLEQVGETYSFLNHTPTIHGVLLQDFLNNVDIGGEISALNSQLSAFNSSRQPKQHDCEVLTGTDHAPCFDQDSCFQACLSVPACRAYNQPSGGALSNEVLAWRLANSQLDGNLSEYSQQLSLISQRGDQSNVAVSSARTVLDRIFPPVATIRANKLFNPCRDCFNYCYPIPFNTTALNSSHAPLDQIGSKLAPMAGFASLAQDIQRRTYVRVNRARFDSMLYNMTATEQELDARAAEVTRIRDPILASNIIQLKNIISQVRAYGAAEDYGPAFLLEPQFYLLVLQISSSIASHKATLDRYDAMMANITTSRLNITANANNVLSLINDSALRTSIGRLENISSQMESLASASNFTGAFELEDDYWWEENKAQQLIINISQTHGEIARDRDGISQKLSSTASKIRSNETQFQQEFANLSATFNSTLRSMGPPIQPANIPGIKANFTQLSQGLLQLNERIDRQREKELKDAYSSQLRRLLGFLLSDAFPRIR